THHLIFDLVTGVLAVVLIDGCPGGSEHQTGSIRTVNTGVPLLSISLVRVLLSGLWNRKT
ncbi:MAG: hypothetical protein ABW185_15725, partial [Sedimenticola sp.]